MTTPHAIQTDPDSALSLYQVYLELLDAVASLLLADASAEGLQEVLAEIGQRCNASVCVLYQHCSPSEEAELVAAKAAWVTESLLPRYNELQVLRHLRYDSFPDLADPLHAGMVARTPLSTLPQLASAYQILGDSQLMLIPLLPRGELYGFVALVRPTQLPWHKIEINILCAVVNDLALALDRDHTAQDLAVNQQRLQALVGATEDIVVECDLQGRVLNLWSDHPQYQKLDYRRLMLEAVLPAGIANPLRDLLPHLLRHKGSRVLRCIDNGSYPPSHYNVRLQAVPDAGGLQHNLVALIRDVTPLVQEEQRWQTMLQTLDLLDEAVLELTASGILRHASTAWARLRGTPEEWIGDDYGYPLSRWVHPQDHAELARALNQLSHGERKQTELRFRLLHPSEPLLWVEARLLAQRPHPSAPLEVHGVLRDVTTAYQNERRIMQMALYDALTELPNRLLLDDRLHEAIHYAKRHKCKVALGFIDLDHFKLINDSLGHKAGDEVLVSLAQRLKAVLREEDTLARWGGDEFVVLLPALTDLSTLAAISERLREVARQGVTVDGLETKPSISIGMAVFPDDADSAQGLLSLADHTLFHAKASGRNNVQFYRDIADRQALDRNHVVLQGWFADAVQKRDLQVFYQPVVDVASGQITSFEALARWYDDQLGWVSPSVFIPLAEKTGLIRELGEVVLDTVLQRLVQWRQRGILQPVAINVARAQLFTAGFVAMLQDKVAQHQLQPADLIIEITESTALADVSRQTHFLNQLESSGFIIALDDFGTGYSSLSQLHEMPVNVLKIDPSFTAKLHTERGRRIVQAVVQMGHALGLRIIAEGVEDEATLRQLVTLGVAHIQGHWFSEAVPAGLVDSLLSQPLRLDLV
ncbi:sensor domain-containing phosphodiesterase [Leeia aquatica]|uniref:EAL domain-containing protein n=1 Tax=Leeia aquatica TaxID=2725557 RepID=A0A847SC95_9NEIS|nr:EAL domain-containing protein [Leeia aquatica]NLR76525.1 EAL domain-containing protein [Leeia aquatica]